MYTDNITLIFRNISNENFEIEIFLNMTTLYQYLTLMYM